MAFPRADSRIARSSLRRTLLVVGITLLVLCLLPFGWIRWTRIEGKRQYQEQLAIASIHIGLL